MEKLNLGDLISDPQNARAHNPRNVGMIEDALREVGAARSIVIDEHGTVLAGNATIEAAAQAGIEDVEVIESDGKTIIAVRRTGLTEDQKRRLALYDNRTAELASWDPDVIASIQAENSQLLKGLFSKNEVAHVLDMLRQTEDPEAETELSTADLLQEKWATRPGDLWLIPSKTNPGRAHALACADCRDHLAWVRVLQGDKAQVVYTDPPYGVSYDADGHTAMVADSLTGEALTAFLRDAFAECARAAIDTAAFYIWHASATRDEFSLALKAAGLQERQYLIWAKPTQALGWADYAWAHEPCFYACKAGQSADWYGGRDQLTLWRVSLGWKDAPTITVGPGVVLSDGYGGNLTITTKGTAGKSLRRFILKDDRPLKIELDNGATTLWEVARDRDLPHPTVKPTELAVRAFQNSSRPGDVVCDAFTGSGGAAVAAETIGRIFRGLELEPKYVAVTLERLAGLGLKPQRQGAD